MAAGQQAHIGAGEGIVPHRDAAGVGVEKTGDHRRRLRDVKAGRIPPDGGTAAENAPQPVHLAGVTLDFMKALAEVFPCLPVFQCGDPFFQSGGARLHLLNLCVLLGQQRLQRRDALWQQQHIVDPAQQVTQDGNALHAFFQGGHAASAPFSDVVSETSTHASG